MKNYTFVANWKMYFPFNESVAFATAHKEGFAALAKHSDATIVLCPSFESIASVYTVLKDTGVSIGAQDCSTHTYGSYTGQISVSSLKETGCTHVIIGHSERRSVAKETMEDISDKALVAFFNGLTPIICFGEDIVTHHLDRTVEVIEAQARSISSLFHALKINTSARCIYLAYEPAWSIGTGKIASAEHITKAFDIVLSMMEESVPRSAFRLLYGGSVNHENHKMLTKIKELDGFLIGKASLDFQSFKNILDYTREETNR